MKFRQFVATATLMMGPFCLAPTSRALAATPKAAAPETIVKAFYSYHFSHDMAFTPENLNQRAQWLTPELVTACQAYFALPEDPDEAPTIDGDVFTGSQEYPDAVAAGQATTSFGMAYIPVAFLWRDHRSAMGTVVLKTLMGRWLIDDVEFADQGSVRRLLARESRPKAR